MSVHDGVKYSCNQCDSKFSRQDNLKIHKMSVHEGVKYSCNQCDYKGSHKSHLKKHKIDNN